MTNQYSALKPKFVATMEEEMNGAPTESAHNDGSSRILLWDTVKRFASRMNMLMMFGDDIANTPEFVDRGLKYIDEVTFVAEAAKNFPAFLVPFLRWLITGRNQNQKYILHAIASEINGYRTSDNPNGKTGSPAPAWSRARVTNSATQLYPARHEHHFCLVDDRHAHYDHPARPRHLHPSGIPPSPPSRTRQCTQRPEPGFYKTSFAGRIPGRVYAHTLFLINSYPLRPPGLFVFHDGYAVPKGEIVEFYQYSTMKDGEIYLDPERFDMERHRVTGRAATDMGREWPFRGNSKLACFQIPRYTCENAPLLDTFWQLNFFNRTGNRFLILSPLKYLVIPPKVLPSHLRAETLNREAVEDHVARRHGPHPLDHFDSMPPPEALAPVGREKVHLEILAGHLLGVDEVRTTFQGYEDIDADSLVTLPFLNAVINETLQITVNVKAIIPHKSPGAIIHGNYILQESGQDLNFERDARLYAMWKKPGMRVRVCLPVATLNQALRVYLGSFKVIFYATAALSGLGLVSLVFLDDIELKRKDLGNRRFEDNKKKFH
ncbi:hypothetical protein P171DRAFT_485884 [Karstenula rhodostoma CBS 690.94]|uniref:Uncharacterized protein n=1 Tax=Karstenula rhodostoma CBS 690.94 TaxID=1392251 RepID=A0A9P4PG35_9PLEO|nr:hypothetical protein P171DRAFT_485884 [Karstenula rhodostoma CBS 690.94]